jgi:hypothetical protein
MKAKHSLVYSLFILVMVQMLVSCVYRENVLVSDSKRITQQRLLRGFERIDIYGSPTVYYTQADSFSVRLEGPENILSEVLTEVEGNVLSVRNKGKIGIVNISVGSVGDVNVYVSSPDLIGVQLFGSGDFKAERHVDTDNMSIALRGSGDIDFSDIICDNCSSELVGSGDVKIRRLKAITSSISLVGSGDMTISQWDVKKTDINLRGSGDVKVNFVEGCKAVSCNLVGSGDITLKGHLDSVEKHKTGSGDIEHLQ